MVGGTAAGGALELGKQGIVFSDEIIKDLDIPIMSQALELQDDVFKIADEIGVGAEVRAAVYLIRGAQYAASIAANAGLSVGAGAGAAVFSGIGGVAALGAVAVVALVLFEIFSSDDDEERQKARIKRAQAAALHLRDRLTLAQFAAEQDAARASELGMAELSKMWGGFGTPAEHQKAADLSGKLAAFYRRADAELDPHARDLFESLSNLGRWQAALDEYAKLSWPKRDAIDILFGKSAPRLPGQLQPKIDAETQTASALVHVVKGERRAELAGWIVLVAAAAGAAVAIWAPGIGLGAVRAITRSAGALYSKAKGRL
jgi:hypothetical protein